MKMKRVLSFIAVLLLCASLAIPALAAKYPAGIDESLPRMDDGAGLMQSVPVEALNARARELSAQYQMDIVIVTRRGIDGKTPMEYADDYFDYGGYGWRGEATDDIKTGSGILLLVEMQERDIWISTKGEGMNVFPDSRVNRLIEAIKSELGSGQYRAAFSRFLDEAESRLEDYRNRGNSTGEPTTPAPGMYPAGIDENLTRVVDGAMLLEPDEIAALEERLYALIKQYEMDVVVVTREGLDGKTPMEYADDFFDYEGYGWREYSTDDITTGSGILLLVEMEEREIWISTKGRGMSVFSDSEVEALIDAITPELGDGLYYDAFNSFLSDAEWYLHNYAGSYGNDYNDNYDNDNDYNYNYSRSRYIYFNGGIFFIFLIIGLIVALAVVSSMKKKHNTIRTAVAAHTYQQRFDLTERQDIFLYSNTTRVKIPDDPPHSSGGHISSSGSSHGGGGGSFGGGHSSSSGSSHGGGGGKF